MRYTIFYFLVSEKLIAKKEKAGGKLKNVTTQQAGSNKDNNIEVHTLKGILPPPQSLKNISIEWGICHIL